jgi:hypothetical protein
MSKAAPMDSASYEIPVEFKVAVYDLLMNFARMETAMRVLTGLLERGCSDIAPSTQKDIRQNLADAEVLVERHLSDAASHLLPDDFWTAARDLCNARDQIACCCGLTLTGHTPVGPSFELRGHDVRLGQEPFTVERLNAIARKCDRARSYLGGLIDVHTARARSL